MRFIARSILVLSLFVSGSAPAESVRTDMLIYCGITMIRPMTEIARAFEQREPVKITLAQGGSEDLYLSLRIGREGDLYLPGEPTYRSKYLSEGLLGEVTTVGYNQLALVVKKGNPKQVKGDLKELLRPDLTVIFGNAESGSVGKETRDVLETVGLYQKMLNAAI
ncbi:MAG: substrate-binding domain-containing protein [Gammaproteobacteria bacterium]|nr:substrate-binding domain-containing protein [Gammaproteobacteria bacterium]